VAVTVRGSIGAALVRAGADHRARFELDEPVEAVLEDRLELIAVSHGEVVEQVLMRHPGDRLLDGGPGKCRIRQVFDALD
jgi:hypothetical protein